MDENPDDQVSNDSNQPEPETAGSVEDETHGNEQDETSHEVHDEDVNKQEQDFSSFLSSIGLSSNPFIFSIDPELMVGYKKERRELMEYITQGHRLIMVSGPTGSGKTTLLNWAAQSLSSEGTKVIFLPKPPRDDAEMVSFFRHAFRKPWYLFFLSPRFSSMNDVIDYLKPRRVVVFLDEAHEASPDVLEWFRVMTDQLPRITLVVSGLPRMDEMLRQELETFHQRISMKIPLKSLTLKETRELIRRRIERAGGSGLGPFSGYTKEIYSLTGGIPREVIRICDRMLNTAWKTGQFSVETNRRQEVSERVSYRISLTARQEEVVRILMKADMSPPEIVDSLDISAYKTRQHAIRSVNNILQQLMSAGYVDRIRRGKSYIYSLRPAIRNSLVSR